eukprot:scaffold64_cov248-Pinguiococcus_pyrenoidosus.AAC.1
MSTSRSIFDPGLASAWRSLGTVLDSVALLLAVEASFIGHVLRRRRSSRCLAVGRQGVSRGVLLSILVGGQIDSVTNSDSRGLAALTSVVSGRP